jgi:CPA1 family monovalent cation:H+ antiporter
MTLIQVCALFLALITVIGWLNARFMHLASSIAMLGAGIVGAVVLLAAQTLIAPFWGFNDVRGVVRSLNFTETVLGYLLGFLLFAGGMQVDLRELRRRYLAVFSLATGGVLISTILIGFGAFWAARALRIDLPLTWALVFGALISPTDPVAVIATMRTGAVSGKIGAILQGEALFNDGVGIVILTTVLAFVASGAAPHPVTAVWTVLLESGGGLVFGAVCAQIVVMFLKAIDDQIVEVTATIALAIGVYVVAGLAHLSAPIAAASAGLIMGDNGVRTAMSASTRRAAESFWELVDQVLNAALFLLLGLQVFVLPFQIGEIGLWAAATLLAMAARLLVILPWGAYFRFRHEERGASLVLTWGGLRGALSLALALSLPRGPYKVTLLGMTFAVVVFSVLVQGLTFPYLSRRLQKLGSDPAAGENGAEALAGPP